MAFCATSGWKEGKTMKPIFDALWKPTETRSHTLERNTNRMTANNCSGTQQKMMITTLVNSQHWPNLEVMDEIAFGNGSTGRGVITTSTFRQGDVVCDYHAPEITKEIADSYSRESDETVRKSDYLMHVRCDGGFFLDGHNESCTCHPGMRTVGRLINWAESGTIDCNIKFIFYKFSDLNRRGVLFVATRDLIALEELKYDYGDRTCKDIFSSL